MTEGLVSIVIPSHKGSDSVARAIRSVLNQTYKDVEVIVVDDNGKGTSEQIKTEEAVAQFKEYSNFHYITHDVNKNGSAARNTGARASQGEYLGFLDDDDEYMPHFVQMHIDELKKLPEDYALTYCSLDRYIDGKYVQTFKKTGNGSLLYEVLMHKVVIGSSTLLMKKKAYEKIGGFDESFRRHQDWEFTARIAAEYKVKAIEEVGIIGHYVNRNGPKNYETAKEYRVHYIEKMMSYIETLSKKQQKNIIVSNYVSVMMQLLRKGKIGKFIQEYRNFKLGFYGIPFVVSSLFSYVFVNKNFWTLRKRK